MKDTTTKKPYAVLLYYCFTPIEDPETFREEHHELCLQLGLLGRIIVAAEGLNGTVSGTVENCEAYMCAVKADPRFASTDFKIEYTEAHTFAKLHVRHKAEIVHSDLTHIKPWERTAPYVEPQDLEQYMNREDVVLLDCRSNYEHKLGKYKGAVTLDMENFRDFKDKIAEIEHLKDKTVVTYCTGGIKCEKASAFLLEQGFENVYQLHGGIIKHGIEAGGKDFEGECYVFDGRVKAQVNTVNPVVVSRCYVCDTTSSRMVNCANPECNIHVPICEACGERMDGACSEACRVHPRKRAYNGTGYYRVDTNGYNPHLNAKRLKRDA